MSRPVGAKTRLPFRQSEIERAIRAFRSMGIPIGSIELDPVSGKIKVATTSDAVAETEWDRAVAKA
jgi:hypothetical protein